MFTFIENYWDALVVMLAEMAPYLLLGFFFAGLLRAFVPKNIYKKHLAPRNMKSVVKAAALGIPLPLCSCGVIPTSVGLRREGASHGACTGFLIATPQTGVDSIAATYSLMGLPFAIVRPIAALFTAMLGGWLVNRHARQDETLSAEAAKSGEHDHCDCSNDHCDDDHGHGGCCCEGSREEHAKGGFLHKFATSMHYAFVEMLQDVGKWLVVGLLIAALITVAVPNEWLAALHDYKLLNMLIVLAVAVPMYVCATGSIPIAVSLMAKGLTPGAALVLLMAGPAVNSASILVIGKVFGKRTLWLYVISIVLGSVLFGLGIDYILPQEWFAVSSIIAGGENCTHCLGIMDWVWIAIFLVLLVNAFVSRLWHSRTLSHRHGSDGRHEEHLSECVAAESDVTIYDVSDMACNHCKANVEKIIAEIAGVESVETDLARGLAYVRGDHDHGELERQVAAAGYPTKEKKPS
ncbi:SO_0444 family Cu/Zn efflux transporter [Prevotella sp. OH937_COT-195]|uniref:SO_0444 family Cu/Zn efflux transporter n=1 Tax=Prevotella sp. OH937_COT-195 TaxID=2491051 RepID=UPI000F652461|nr:SO_0444 family Cu/Zn efflux transporter [Prevotella sp. OH937_COT-195]RRD02564.1 heavy metal-associated domain-containing protein [Prevotella sp. OH937_COT-195]